MYPRFLNIPIWLFDNNDGGGSTPPEGDGEKDWKALYEAAQAELANKTTEWNTRLSGLNKTLTAEKDAHKVTKDQALAFQTQIQDLTGNIDALKSEKETLGTQKSAIETAKAELEATLARKTLIMEKFPALASFEAQGLLPQVPAEQAEEVFGKFHQNIQDLRKSQVADQNSGGVPPTPSKKEQTKSSSADLLREASKLALDGKATEYDAMMDKYWAAVDAEKSAK